MGIDLVIEYVAGFGFGLFIFQSLFMKDMMGGSYRAAVRHSVVPEWLSMNFMMAGMFPTMVVLMMGRDMRAMEPTQLVFWGAMSAAVLVGLDRRLPGQRLDGRQGPQARHGDAASARQGRPHDGGRARPLGRAAAGRGGRVMHEHGGGDKPKRTDAQDRGRSDDRSRRPDPPRSAHEGMTGMAGMGSGPSDVAFRATRPQIASIAFMSVVALAGGARLLGVVRQPVARRPRRRRARHAARA